MHHDYPEYPSVKATVDSSRYMEAVQALEGVRQVFCDGETILLPEAEVKAIEMLPSSRPPLSMGRPRSISLRPRPGMQE